MIICQSVNNNLTSLPDSGGTAEYQEPPLSYSFLRRGGCFPSPAANSEVNYNDELETSYIVWSAEEKHLPRRASFAGTPARADILN